MFETRSQAWDEAGLLPQVSPGAVRRARWEALLLVPLFVGVVVLYENRRSLLGLNAHGKGQLAWLETPVDFVTVIVLVMLGWAIARDVGRAFGPALFRRMDPASAGTVGFVIRLVTVALAVIVALGIIGIEPRTLALGGAFTAVILGLAAQQTLGNMFAGTVLLSAGRFASATACACREARWPGRSMARSARSACSTRPSRPSEGPIMVPNSVVLSVAVLARGAPSRRRAGGHPVAQNR